MAPGSTPAPARQPAVGSRQLRPPVRHRPDHRLTTRSRSRTTGDRPPAPAPATRTSCTECSAYTFSSFPRSAWERIFRRSASRQIRYSTDATQSVAEDVPTLCVGTRGTAVSVIPSSLRIPRPGRGERPLGRLPSPPPRLPRPRLLGCGNGVPCMAIRAAGSTAAPAGPSSRRDSVPTLLPHGTPREVVPPTILTHPASTVQRPAGPLHDAA